MPPRTHFRQLIVGNPGTSYITCLLFALHHKYSVPIKNSDQSTLFCNGMTRGRKTFFSGVLEEIARRYGYPIRGYIGNAYLRRGAERETRLRSVDYSTLAPTKAAL